MFCKKCGAKIDDDSIYCGNCGARIIGNQENNFTKSLATESDNSSRVDKQQLIKYLEIVVDLEKHRYAQKKRSKN